MGWRKICGAPTNGQRFIVGQVARYVAGQLYIENADGTLVPTLAEPEHYYPFDEATEETGREW